MLLKRQNLSYSLILLFRDLENQAKDLVSRLKNMKVHVLYARFMSVLGFVQECIE